MPPIHIRPQVTRFLLSLALPPLVIIGGLWLWQISTEGFNEAKLFQDQLAQQVGIQISTVAHNSEENLLIVSKAYDLLSLNRERQQEILLVLLNAESAYEELELLTSNGEELIHLSRVQVISAQHNHAPEVMAPLATLETAYSPISISAQTNEPLIKISIPLIAPRTGKPQGVLIAHARFKTIWELVAALSAKYDKEIYLIDHENRLIAHQNPSLVLRQTQFKPSTLNGIGAGLKNPWALISANQITLGNQTWTIIVESSLLAVLTPTLYAIGAITLTISLFIFLISWLGGLIANYITEPLLQLIQTIHAIRSGNLTQRVSVGGNAEIVELATDFNSMAAQLEQTIISLEHNQSELRATLLEKESLLRELYHRTKNNMQVVSALLEMQVQSKEETPYLRQIVTETQNRIRSMALVHQKLYQSQNLSRIQLAEYVREFTELLIQSYALSPQQISLHLDLHNVEVLIDTAIPCGLILNELISNSLKHGFPNGRAGQINIHLRQTTEGEIVLRVSDDGVGAAPDFDFSQQDSLGLGLIDALTKQLHGQVCFTSPPGLTCELTFKDNLHQARI